MFTRTVKSENTKIMKVKRILQTPLNTVSLHLYDINLFLRDINYIS